jgi:hypothetical protein
LNDNTDIFSFKQMIALIFKFIFGASFWVSKTYLLNSSSQPCHCNLQFTNFFQITTTDLNI